MTLALAVGSVCAAELSYGLQYMGEQTSNIRRTPTNEQDETINSVMLSARYRELLPTFRSEISASSERREYTRGTFQDETLFLFDGTVVWIPYPNFSWLVADNYRNLPASRALPDTPANRENTNVFLTGPTLEWRLAPADSLIAEARYGRFDADESDIDNDRYSNALRWRHRHSSLAENSINYEQLSVEFDNDVANSNYRRQDVFYRGIFRRGRNEATIDLGYTDIERERLPDVDGSLFRLAATREISAARRTGLAVSSRYSDTALDLAPAGIATTSRPSSPTTLTPETLTSDIFYTKRADAFLTSTAAPFPWSLDVFSSHIDYENDTADVKEAGGQLTVSYLRTENLRFNAYSSYNKAKYPILNRTDHNRVNGLGATLRLTRTVEVSLEGQRAERHSSDATQSYVDDRVFLRLIYNVTRRWN